VKVIFFGKLGESIGREIAFDVPPDGCSVAQLRTLLGQRFPVARADLEGPALRACVNDAIVDDAFVVTPGLDVEFFPPLSGG
jgi:molybdopterin converting factor small subunit